MIRETLSNEYIGLSTDTKPTDCPEGSTFYCVDTLEYFIFVGGTWYLKN